MQAFNTIFEATSNDGNKIAVRQSAVDLEFTIWVNGKRDDDVESEVSLGNILHHFAYYFEVGEVA